MTPEAQKYCGLFRAATAVIVDYQEFLQRLRYGRDAPKGKPSCYGYIPNRPYEVMMCLKVAYKLLHDDPSHDVRSYKRYKFLDAGCGVGNIMLMAKRLGFESYGIDNDDKTIALARKLLRCGREKIIQADLTKYRSFGKYDVIYYFTPMFDTKPMHKFVIRLAGQMKVGAIVIPFGRNYFSSDDRFKKCSFTDVHVYRKIKGGRRTNNGRKN